MTRLRADLRAMMRDGIAFSAMVGVGESYLPAFVLALGYGSVSAGLVATLPMLAGALFQLGTPAAVGLLRSHRRWVVICAALQALTFIPLISGAIDGELSLGVIYITASLYWGFGMSTGPAWTAWATTLVPKSIRARFFAQRARFSQASLFLALVVGGSILDRGGAQEWLFAAFALIFALALGSRVLSAAYLAAQSEPKPAPIGETKISPAAVRSHIRTGGHGRLLLYMLVFQLSVWIAAPYFTPYMLGPLKLSYMQFTWLTATAFLARVLVLPALGRAARHVGIRRMLYIASLGITPLPALWLVSDSLVWLFLLQLLSGAAWAGFELASLLAFFERIPRQAQTSILTVYNLANALAIVGGSAIGGWLLTRDWAGLDGFVIVLVISTSARVLSLSLLRGVPDTDEPDSIPSLRTLSVRPSTGAVQRPILIDGQDAPK